MVQQREELAGGPKAACYGLHKLDCLPLLGQSWLTSEPGPLLQDTLSPSAPKRPFPQ